MAIANDSVVSIEYEVKEKATGDLVDTNFGGEPLEFLMGSGQIIPGLEEAIALMSNGESKTVDVVAAKAYGEVDPAALQSVEIEQFAGIDLVVGMTLYGQAENGQTVQVIVREIGDNEVVVDYNHPLAGKDLTFNINVVAVREATEGEKATGMVERAGGSCCGGGCGCSH